MRKLALSLATLTCIALMVMNLGSGPHTISKAEGEAIFGGECGHYSLDSGGGCNPVPGWGPKFWESCPATGTLTDGLTYHVAAAQYTCTTTCGYQCGTYTSGYTQCGVYP